MAWPKVGGGGGFTLARIFLTPFKSRKRSWRPDKVGKVAQIGGWGGLGNLGNARIEKFFFVPMSSLILIAPINLTQNSYTLARPFNKWALNRFEARIQHHKTVIINRCFPAVPICQACHTPPWTAGRWLSRGPQLSLLSLRRVKSKNLESLNVSTISVTRGHE